MVGAVLDGVPREQALQSTVLYLSRVRRNWIDAEVERVSSQPPRRVLGETYETDIHGNKVRGH